MADDGMLVNFAVPDAYVPPPTKFKGGAWRERARLKKNAKNRGYGERVDAGPRGSEDAYKRAIRGKETVQTTRDNTDPRPSKRARTDGEFNTSSGKQGSPRNQSSNGMKKSGGSREVISSLFSYNPVSQSHEENTTAETQDETPAKPSNAPLPDGIDTFTSFGVLPNLAAHLLTKMDLKNPTAIQRSAVSQLIKEDADVFIQSETGSGKTLAYLLPIVQRIMSSAALSKHEDDQAVHRDSGLFAIIIAPTRELCKQILDVLQRLLGCAHFIVGGVVIGGESKKSEKARLRKGLNILVATPGRLVDHLENTEALDVSQVRYLVMDEGDRLMELGFEEDITKIVKTLDSKKRKNTKAGLPDRRITILCSATLKSNVQKLGDISLKDAVLVRGTAGPDETAENGIEVCDRIDSPFLAPAQLKQSYIAVAAKLRLVTLTALLRRTFARRGSVMKAIVFVSCADSVEFHYKAFTRDLMLNPNSVSSKAEVDQPAESTSLPDHVQDAIAQAPQISSSDNNVIIHKLHGSLPQISRSAIVKAFATATTPSLLVATDVASRGLDLPNLDLVIEYDPAFSTDDHLHRIGRTARLGRDGRTIIFLLPGKEEGYVEVLKKSYKTNDATAGTANSSPNVTSQSVDEVLKKGFSPTSGIVSDAKEWEKKATEFQLDVERWILADAQNKELAKKAFQSHIRAYATHVASERKWFDIKELHLGHLAKAFGLRDPPGKVNVQGMRGSNNVGKNISNRANEGRKRDQRGEVDQATAVEVKSANTKGAEIDAVGDAADSMRRMRDMVKNRKRMMGAGVDEFNLA